MDTPIIRSTRLIRALNVIVYHAGSNKQAAARLIGVSPLSLLGWLSEEYEPSIDNQRKVIVALTVVVHQLNAKGDPMYAEFAASILKHLKLVGVALPKAQVHRRRAGKKAAHKKGDVAKA